MSPGEVDPRVVRRHLMALGEVVENLARHKGVTPERLTRDADQRWIVERGLQLAAQNVLDIATHIAAGEGRDVPDYATGILILGRVGVLPPDFADSLHGLAGFRNLLVHGYLEVDLGLMCGLVNDHLGDFHAFAAHVEQYLERRA